VVEALLRTRGPQGATQEELEQVVTWARAVRSEGQALTDAMKRPTRQKQEKFGERVVQHEMNTVLLNGVLAGSIGLDVKNGSIVYLHGNGSNAAAADTGATAGEPLAADAGA
jgi:poly(3-hydroxybutyrate) depolymerase